jgi:hypothetical protein
MELEGPTEGREIYGCIRVHHTISTCGTAFVVYHRDSSRCTHSNLIEFIQCIGMRSLISSTVEV